MYEPKRFNVGDVVICVDADEVDRIKVGQEYTILWIKPESDYLMPLYGIEEGSEDVYFGFRFRLKTIDKFDID